MIGFTKDVSLSCSLIVLNIVLCLSVEPFSTSSSERCQQEKKVGPCRALMKRWYFNSETQQCDEFKYGGCQGNENNFETSIDCQTACHGFSKYCKLEKKTGPCRALLKRWYFNSETLQCEEFNYGGCQANENNFETSIDCETACHGFSNDNDDVVTYKGSISEDAKYGDEVEMVPRVSAKKTAFSSRVCGYTIYKSFSKFPFKVLLLNQSNGDAKIELSAGYTLNYEETKQYEFKIAPRDCDTGIHGNKETVIIKVKDVNEFAPKTEKDSYVVEVFEGKLYDEILRLNEVNDPDGSPHYGSACHYKIATPKVPFSIDSDGVLFNSKPLVYATNHNFILDVRIQNCGNSINEDRQEKKESRVNVNVIVKEACSSGWKGFATRIDYPPTSGIKVLAPQATLDTCDSICKEESISARVVLSTNHIGKGCDRDTYSIESQRKICKASPGSIDLLPSPSSVHWNSLPTDDGKEGDEIFSFDGSHDRLIVEDEKLNHTLGSRFSIMAWLKHEKDLKNMQSHKKEHIFCNSDSAKMNRHHYSLFIHNCRLVLLYRQEPLDSNLEVFKPAEWRWSLNEICDGQWHHYAINMDFPKVRLFVDGRLFADNEHNHEIIDDWPMHPTKKVHATKLYIGACYEGRSEKTTQYYRGFMAGLAILKDKTESDRVIRCLNDCKEKLDFHAMSEMETGMSVAFNSEMTEITINGHNRSEVEKLVRRIGYSNSRLFPTRGDRSIKIESSIKCKSGRKLNIDDTESRINVLPADDPIITINGTHSLNYQVSELLNGKTIFSDVMIISQTNNQMEENPHFTYYDVVAGNLDKCIISVSPPMTLKYEHLKWQENEMAILKLAASQNESGLIISGSDKISSYLKVLRHIKYVHRNAGDLNSRTFKLQCSELNARFISNVFDVKIMVIHENHIAGRIQPVHMIESKHSVNDLSLDQDSILVRNSPISSNATVGVSIIVIVCVGFLAFMIILGVIRIKAAHQRSQSGIDEKAEMEWDNSALTITVNPMDQEVIFSEETELRGEETDTDEDIDDDDEDDDDDEEDEDDEDEDDEGSDLIQDDMESSEEEPEVVTVKNRDLEWDDSTLTF